MDLENKIWAVDGFNLTAVIEKKHGTNNWKNICKANDILLGDNIKEQKKYVKAISKYPEVFKTLKKIIKGIVVPDNEVSNLFKDVIEAHKLIKEIEAI